MDSRGLVEYDCSSDEAAVVEGVPVAAGKSRGGAESHTCSSDGSTPDVLNVMPIIGHPTAASAFERHDTPPGLPSDAPLPPEEGAASTAPACAVCHAEPSKYKCPSCHVRTCSLRCVKQHKTDSACVGKTFMHEYVDLQSLKQPEILREDFKFLEEVSRVAGAAQRTIRGYGTAAAGRRGAWRPEEDLTAAHTPLTAPLPKRLAKLVQAAAARHVQLSLMPKGMQRHDANTSEWVPEPSAPKQQANGGKRKRGGVGSAGASAGASTAPAPSASAAAENASAPVPGATDSEIALHPAAKRVKTSLPGEGSHTLSNVVADNITHTSDSRLGESTRALDSAVVPVQHGDSTAVALQQEGAMPLGDATASHVTPLSNVTPNSLEETSTANAGTMHSATSVGTTTTSTPTLTGGTATSAASECINATAAVSAAVSEVGQAGASSTAGILGILGRMLWRVEVECPAADPPYTLTLERVDETRTCDSMYAHLVTPPAPGALLVDADLHYRMRAYHAPGSGPHLLLLRHPFAQRGVPTVHAVAGSQSLREALAHKRILEFPTFVLLPASRTAHWQSVYTPYDPALAAPVSVSVSVTSTRTASGEAGGDGGSARNDSHSNTFRPSEISCNTAAGARTGATSAPRYPAATNNSTVDASNSARLPVAPTSSATVSDKPRLLMATMTPWASRGETTVLTTTTTTTTPTPASTINTSTRTATATGATSSSTSS